MAIEKKKEFTTETDCPYCGEDIYKNLEAIYRAGNGKDFKAKCPLCEEEISVEVGHMPAFKIWESEKDENA